LLNGYLELIELIFKRTLLDLRSKTTTYYHDAHTFLFSEHAEWLADIAGMDVNIFRERIEGGL